MFAKSLVVGYFDGDGAMFIFTELSTFTLIILTLILKPATGSSTQSASTLSKLYQLQIIVVIMWWTNMELLIIKRSLEHCEHMRLNRRKLVWYDVTERRKISCSVNHQQNIDVELSGSSFQASSSSSSSCCRHNLYSGRVHASVAQRQNRSDRRCGVQSPTLVVPANANISTLVASPGSGPTAVPVSLGPAAGDGHQAAAAAAAMDPRSNIAPSQLRACDAAAAAGGCPGRPRPPGLQSSTAGRPFTAAGPSGAN